MATANKRDDMAWMLVGLRRPRPAGKERVRQYDALMDDVGRDAARGLIGRHVCGLFLPVFKEYAS